MNSFSKALTVKQRLHFFKRRFQLIFPFYFAHHSLCNNYSQEVFKIGSWFICRGCALVYSSAVISFLGSVLFNPFRIFSLMEVFFLVLIISSPTWLGFIFPLRNRRMKDMIRISMGFGWGIALAEIWLQPLWSDKIIILLLMITFLVIFQQIRKFKTSRTSLVLCDNCKELNNDACEGFRSQFEAERLYSRELSDFLQQQLTWSDVQKRLKKT
ncbi:MAG: hypothetical protein ACXACP_12165 [Candidatus Hodarchaeales archaeon]|jgi:uncharacterized membrane protein